MNNTEKELKESIRVLTFSFINELKIKKNGYEINIINKYLKDVMKEITAKIKGGNKLMAVIEIDYKCNCGEEITITINDIYTPDWPYCQKCGLAMREVTRRY